MVVNTQGAITTEKYSVLYNHGLNRIRIFFHPTSSSVQVFEYCGSPMNTLHTQVMLCCPFVVRKHLLV